MSGTSIFEITNEEGKLEYKKAADYLAEKFFIRIPSDTKEIMVYNKDKGIYEEGSHLVHNELIRAVDKKANSHALKEVVHFLKGSPELQYDVNKHDTRHIVTLANGHYNIKEDFFFDHNWQHYAITQLPIKYDENADCPRIKKFIGEVVGEENVELVRECIGYCLYRDYPIHKAFMFVGNGRNGKSVLINLIKRFLGTDNYCSISLQALAENRFAVITLHNKLANLYPDLDRKGLRSTGMFKILTGNDSVSVDRKFKEPITLSNYAKMIFSANELPRSSDMTNAFFRRWVILNFPNTFNGEKCDTNLIEKLSTDEELSGLFNWVVGGLKNLLKRGEFISTKSTEDTEKEYLRRSSSADAFVKESLIYNSTNFITKHDLYEVYCSWCEKHCLTADEIRNLTGAVQKVMYSAKQTQRRVSIDNKLRQAKGWLGIDYKEGLLDGLVEELADNDEKERPNIDDIQYQDKLVVDEYEV